MRQCITLTLPALLLMILGACVRGTEVPTGTENIGTALQSGYTQPQKTGEPSVVAESTIKRVLSICLSFFGQMETPIRDVIISVGDSTFTVKLYDNETAAEFLTRLPVTLDMSELNGNEKYYNLPDRLPTDSRQPGSINTGDLMLYGSDCLVLFYESFSTVYSYTKIGYIENAVGLANALGRGGARVTFEISEQ